MNQRQKDAQAMLWKKIEELCEEKGLSLNDLQAKISAQTEEDDENMQLDMIELGIRLSETREKRGYSLIQVAKWVDIPVGELQLIEAGYEHSNVIVVADVISVLDLEPKEAYEGLFKFRKQAAKKK